MNEIMLFADWFNGWGIELAIATVTMGFLSVLVLDLWLVHKKLKKRLFFDGFCRFFGRSGDRRRSE